MKEWKKWWSRQGSGICKLSISMGNPDGILKEYISELSWKAALELVLEKIGLRSPDGRKGCQNFIDLLKEDIEEELKDA